MFKKRAHVPVESRSYATYYLLFSALLFLGTAWAVWDEISVRRPWKEYQAEYHRLVAEKLEALYLSELEQVDSTEVLQLEQALREAQAKFDSEEYRKAVDRKTSLQKSLDIATREWRFARSRSDAAYYQFKKAVQEGRESTGWKAEVEKHDADIVRWAAEMDSLNERIGEVSRIVNRYRDTVDSLQIELNRIFSQARSYATKLERARLQPIRIHQVLLNDFEFTPFSEIKARVDRCQTCHAGWADELMEDAPQPFTKHPVPELLAKHNPERFGCTPCHRGQGPALTTGYAHGDEDHYWETPLLRGVDVYASCNSCHSEELILKHAAPFSKAKQLMFDSGCYGCHEIKGFTDLPKIGPPLNSLGAKVQSDWLFRWVRNPKDYNPHTRMPNFAFADEDARAVTSYLMKVSRESGYQPVRARGAYSGGSAARGKTIFESIGCQACHTIGEDTRVREARGTSYDIAPELSRVGSKVNPDWLFDWLKNPRHYNPEARMPSLRLTDDEARHLVAYLMTLKDIRNHPLVEITPDEPGMIERGERLIREYGCAGCHSIKGMETEGKVSVALSDFGRKRVEQMDFGDTRELPLDAPEEYVENPDGTVSVKHTWRGWVTGKLRNARLYATERIAQKMPLYSFNEEEVKLLRMLLIGMTREVPLPAYQHEYDKRQRDIEAGRRLTMQYNCAQCHTLEEGGGAILSIFEDAGLGPPPLPESQGAKVQEQWLHGFLRNPTTVRPWLQIRMPTFNFTEAEIGTVMRYFLALSKQDFAIRDYAATPIDRSFLPPGRELFDVYQCARCHPTGPVRLSGDAVAAELAPDLSLSAGRLKPEWIVDWLRDPQKLQPGTRMPTYFFEGQGPDPTIFEGRAEDQIKALKTYVWSLGRRKAAGAASP